MIPAYLHACMHSMHMHMPALVFSIALGWFPKYDERSVIVGATQLSSSIVAVVCIAHVST
jgi:hypothetical protein